MITVLLIFNGDLTAFLGVDGTHDTIAQNRFNCVDPSPTTLAQHWVTSYVCRGDRLRVRIKSTDESSVTKLFINYKCLQKY